MSGRRRSTIHSRRTASFFVADDALAFPDDKNVRKALGVGTPSADGAKLGLDHLRAMHGVLTALPEWTQPALEAAANAYAAEHAGGKMGSVAQPLRIAVSGSTISPPIWDTLVLVGRDASLARLERCIAWASRLG
jgi:glutamyl-tRNA synthetase